MSYTDKINYLTPPTFSGVCAKQPSISKRTKIDSENPIYNRAHKLFNTKHFLYPAPPVCLGPIHLTRPSGDLFVLRLCIKMPDSKWCVPKELEWTLPFIENCISYQHNFFPHERFYYMTIRHGENLTSQEDTFHVDGFQAGITEELHLPQQVYLWADRDPTLFALQPYFVEDLDSSKHNIHLFLDKKTKKESCYQGLPNHIYLLDPYMAHAKPKGLIGRRTTVRLSCILTDVKDDTNTLNPALPMGPYNKPDPRNYLWEYPYDNGEIKYGLKSII